MEKVQFNQENVDNKIGEIKDLPDSDREAIATQIKTDIRGWLQNNFTFTNVEENCMENWPQSMREETGFGIGTALYYPEWSLTVDIPNDSPPVGIDKKKHTQTVSGSYDPRTGSYTVTKSFAISW